MSWTEQNLPDQSRRTVIVTGGNSGIGRVTAAALAAAGARVVLAVRDESRGREAAAQMRGAVEVRRLDLADLASVRAFADGWHGQVDVLINNAGIMAVPLRRTVDGFESQFGTNHLGHFALTNLLLPWITDRVVTVSSGAHRIGRINLEDLNWNGRRYKAWAAYGQSKLANLLFTLELDRRLAAENSIIRAVAAHPGYAATNLQSHASNPVARTLLTLANRVVAQSDSMGALPSLYAATADIPGCSYVGPDGRRETSGHPTLVGRSPAAMDDVLARTLWTASEALTGISFPAQPRPGRLNATS